MRYSWLPTVLAGLFLGVTLWGAAASVQAQTGTKPAPTVGGKSKSSGKHEGAKHEGGKGALKRMLLKLNLTPDQVTKLKALEATNKQTAAGIQANKTLTADQKKTLVKAEGKNLRKEVEVLLTPAQKEKMKGLMLQAAMERKNKMAAAGKAAPTGTTPAAHK